ncbi:MAG: FAD-binding protein, partial [Thaumarchaeota archaeon]|nr:FAD-binding protein [Nitrososphaerota archaeon]
MLSTHEFKHSSNSHPENDPACHKCDVLVIGGGAAGSAAAIRAKELGADVVLADKSVFGSSGCAALASGDLRVYFPEDDIEPHLRGRGDLANYAAARRQLEASYNVFLELERWGVPFVREKGKLWREESPSGGFDVALLGGGPAMMKAVRRKALESGVRVVNRVMIVDLLTSDGKLPTGGCAVGAIGFDTRTAKIHVFQSRSIIVCAGGFGFPYPKIGTPLTSMPIDVSGDGLAMEIRVGAVMGNLSIGAKHFHSMEFFTAPGLEHSPNG